MTLRHTKDWFTCNNDESYFYPKSKQFNVSKQNFILFTKGNINQSDQIKSSFSVGRISVLVELLMNRLVKKDNRFA